MSWFSDIAGRAEDLLNKVDKSAAHALQKGMDNSQWSPPKSRSPYVTSEGGSPPAMTPLVPRDALRTPALSMSGGAAAPPLQSWSAPSPSGQSNTSSPRKSSRVRRQEDEDQELLAFLNSPEPLASVQPAGLAGTSAPTAAAAAAMLVVAKDPAIQTSSPGDQDRKSVAEDTILLDKNAEDAFPCKEEGQAVAEMQMEQPQLVTAELASSSIPVAIPSEDHSVDSGGIQQGSGLEQEFQRLRSELAEGRRLCQGLQRTLQEEQGEKKRLQKKLDHWTTQVSESDGLLRELQGRENDMKDLLAAKDSQLAVLRVRLQEADQQLDSCRSSLTDTQSQLEQQLDVNSLQQQSLDSLRSKLSEAEAAIRDQQRDNARAQSESQELLSQKEEEVRSLTQSLAASQKSLQQLRGQSRDMVRQLSQSSQSLEAAQRELSQYRSKAQRILHSKEKLIVALKERSGSSEDTLEESFQIVDPPGDTEGDRDSLREELAQAQALGQTLRQELAACEQALALETQAQEEQLQAMQEKVRSEEQKRREVQLELQQSSEELRYLREDLTRTKTSLQARIKDRETEIERLRKQVTAKSLSQVNGGNGGMSSSQQRELESRLKNLTESLIQKQTLVEALSTEKNSLSMQMEVLERKLKELQGSSGSGKIPTHIVGISPEGAKERHPSIFLESPYDSNLTKKVKRAYSALDALSIRMGSFLRRYPASRAFLLLYMVLLHLWVMVVLCTYQPEIHPVADKKQAL